MKLCCYIDRECTEDCIAYAKNDEGEFMGCLRLLSDINLAIDTHEDTLEDLIEELEEEDDE